MGTCCIGPPEHRLSSQKRTRYETLEEQQLVEFKPDYKEYSFSLRIVVDLRQVDHQEGIDKFRFIIMYGEVVRDWFENFKYAIDEVFYSKSIHINFNPSLFQQDVFVQVFTLNSKKKIIQKISDKFNFLRAAVAIDTCIESDTSKNSVIKLSMFENADESNSKQHFTYKLEIEYDPSTIPIEETEKVSFLITKYIK